MWVFFFNVLFSFKILGNFSEIFLLNYGFPIYCRRQRIYLVQLEAFKFIETYYDPECGLSRHVQRHVKRMWTLLRQGGGFYKYHVGQVGQQR